MPPPCPTAGRVLTTPQHGRRSPRRGAPPGAMGDLPKLERVPLHVVGTAGHVDHGKSSLVLALTGTDPDRLAEEKRRGMTIEPGFAARPRPRGGSGGMGDAP